MPDKVTNLNCETRLRKNNTNALETILCWNLPCSLKGRLKHFEINVFGSRHHSEDHVITASMNIQASDSLRKNQKFCYNFGELRPEYQYVFSVSAAIRETDEKGEVAKFRTEYPAGSKNSKFYSLLCNFKRNYSLFSSTSTGQELRKIHNSESEQNSTHPNVLRDSVTSVFARQWLCSILRYLGVPVRFQ